MACQSLQLIKFVSGLLSGLTEAMHAITGHQALPVILSTLNHILTRIERNTDVKVL